MSSHVGSESPCAVTNPRFSENLDVLSIINNPTSAYNHVPPKDSKAIVVLSSPRKNYSHKVSDSQSLASTTSSGSATNHVGCNEEQLPLIPVSNKTIIPSDIQKTRESNNTVCSMTKKPLVGAQGDSIERRYLLSEDSQEQTGPELTPPLPTSHIENGIGDHVRPSQKMNESHLNGFKNPQTAIKDGDSNNVIMNHNQAHLNPVNSGNHLLAHRHSFPFFSVGTPAVASTPATDGTFGLGQTPKLSPHKPDCEPNIANENTKFLSFFQRQSQAQGDSLPRVIVTAPDHGVSLNQPFSTTTSKSHHNAHHSSLTTLTSTVPLNFEVNSSLTFAPKHPSPLVTPRQNLPTIHEPRSQPNVESNNGNFAKSNGQLVLQVGQNGFLNNQNQTESTPENSEHRGSILRLHQATTTTTPAVSSSPSPPPPLAPPVTSLRIPFSTVFPGPPAATIVGSSIQNLAVAPNPMGGYLLSSSATRLYASTMGSGLLVPQSPGSSVHFYIGTNPHGSMASVMTGGLTPYPAPFYFAPVLLKDKYPHYYRQHFQQIAKSMNETADASHLQNSGSFVVSESGALVLCRICQTPGTEQTLISPCKCTGSVRYVHKHCLTKWLEINPNRNRKSQMCELCQYTYHRAKKFKFKDWKWPHCSTRDKLFHLLFIISMLVMMGCASAFIVCFKRDKGVIRKQEELELNESEIITLSCGVLFFLSFFLGMYAEIKAHNPIYKICSQTLSMNQSWIIEDYYGPDDDNCSDDTDLGEDDGASSTEDTNAASSANTHHPITTNANTGNFNGPASKCGTRNRNSAMAMLASLFTGSRRTSNIEHGPSRRHSHETKSSSQQYQMATEQLTRTTKRNKKTPPSLNSSSNHVSVRRHSRRRRRRKLRTLKTVLEDCKALHPEAELVIQDSLAATYFGSNRNIYNNLTNQQDSQSCLNLSSSLRNIALPIAPPTTLITSPSDMNNNNTNINVISPCTDLPINLLSPQTVNNNSSITANSNRVDIMPTIKEIIPSLVGSSNPPSIATLTALNVFENRQLNDNKNPLRQQQAQQQPYNEWLASQYADSTKQPQHRERTISEDQAMFYSDPGHLPGSDPFKRHYSLPVNNVLLPLT